MLSEEGVDYAETLGEFREEIINYLNDAISEVKSRGEEAGPLALQQQKAVKIITAMAKSVVYDGKKLIELFEKTPDTGDEIANQLKDLYLSTKAREYLENIDYLAENYLDKKNKATEQIRAELMNAFLNTTG